MNDSPAGDFFFAFEAALTDLYRMLKRTSSSELDSSDSVRGVGSSAPGGELGTIATSVDV